MSGRNRKKRGGDDGGAGGGWIVSFNDIMLSLLAFFVMLISFSAFDQESLTRVRGTLQAISRELPSPRMRQAEALLPPERTVTDYTKRGTEIREDAEPKTIRNPERLRPEVDRGAFRGVKTFRVSSEMLFIARGAVISKTGKKLLSKVRKLLELQPAAVILSEVGPGLDGADELPMRRAWAVARYLAGGPPDERFALATGSPLTEASPSERALQMTLVSESHAE